ncbi:protein PTST homolog 3, chloroplastic isoform X2 [Euphorbia lathyris]|uniref:protein PTST homolog 3, chloroplastic isoform X2 n=1 Tax=Euphorbia lathyris TaxID=212925 RepID=UPI003313191F
MATLYQSPCFLLLPSRKFSPNQAEFRFNLNTHLRTRRKGFRICVCAAKKSRRRNNVKSNEELCNDIREFISGVGLPEGHFPTMKEFSAHGRTDLANIVRRRGYKLVRDLLSNSREAEISGFNVEQKLAEQQDAISHNTGQDEKVEDIVEDSSSTDIRIIEDDSSNAGINPESSYSDHRSSSSVGINPESSNSDHRISEESSADESSNAGWQTFVVKSMVKELTSSENEELQDGVEDSSLSTSYDKEEHNDREVWSTAEDNSSSRQVLIMVKFHGKLNENLETKSDVIDCIPEETSDNYLSEEKARKNSQSQDEKANVMAEPVSHSPRVSYSKYPANDVNVVSGLNRGDHELVPMDLAANTSLEDKVAKFIQDGELDAIGDDVYGTLDERTEESERFIEPQNETESRSKSPSEGNREHAFIRNGVASASNGSMSEQFRIPARANHLVRNDDLSAEDLASSNMREDVDDEISVSGNHVQINRLKFLLHQKELELSHMKEQIEKEKLSLSDLQMKTETEIIKAQKFISEKEAELLAAEEGLSGLVEVNIQYSGEGEIVEVAGSFNGWHHPIKMDPYPSSSNVDSTGSRQPRLWSTMLWLYPGLYEIKFIVDGEWTVDEERESITKAGICNNILRVIR